MSYFHTRLQLIIWDMLLNHKLDLCTKVLSNEESQWRHCHIYALSVFTGPNMSYQHNLFIFIHIEWGLICSCMMNWAYLFTLSWMWTLNLDSDVQNPRWIGTDHRTVSRTNSKGNIVKLNCSCGVQLWRIFRNCLHYLPHCSTPIPAPTNAF